MKVTKDMTDEQLKDVLTQCKMKLDSFSNQQDEIRQKVSEVNQLDSQANNMLAIRHAKYKNEQRFYSIIDGCIVFIIKVYYANNEIVYTIFNPSVNRNMQIAMPEYHLIHLIDTGKLQTNIDDVVSLPITGKIKEIKEINNLGHFIATFRNNTILYLKAYEGMLEGWKNQKYDMSTLIMIDHTKFRKGRRLRIRKHKGSRYYSVYAIDILGYFKSLEQFQQYYVQQNI